MTVDNKDTLKLNGTNISHKRNNITTYELQLLMTFFHIMKILHNDFIINTCSCLYFFVGGWIFAMVAPERIRKERGEILSVDE